MASSTTSYVSQVPPRHDVAHYAYGYNRLWKKLGHALARSRPCDYADLFRTEKSATLSVPMAACGAEEVWV